MSYKAENVMKMHSVQFQIHLKNEKFAVLVVVQNLMNLFIRGQRRHDLLGDVMRERFDVLYCFPFLIVLALVTSLTL